MRGFDGAGKTTILYPDPKPRELFCVQSMTDRDGKSRVLGSDAGAEWLSRGGFTKAERPRALEVFHPASGVTKKAGHIICWSFLQQRPCKNHPCLCLHLGSSDNPVCQCAVERFVGQRLSECSATEACTRRHQLEKAECDAILMQHGEGWIWQENTETVVQPQPLVLLVPVRTELVSEGLACPEESPMPNTEVAFWAREVQSRYPTNAQLLALLDEPWLQSMLASPGSSKLWRGKQRTTILKELSESYAALRLIRQHCPTLSPESAPIVIFDVCSGIGLTSLMLSSALSHCRIIMCDSNPKMKLGHLSGPMREGRVKFFNLSIFGAAFEQLVQSEAAQAPWSCAVGTHLCGALSPRLIALFQSSPKVNLLVLSPCCLKGWLGAAVRRRAQEENREDYAVLCEELCGMASSGGSGEAPTVGVAATVSLHFDPADPLQSQRLHRGGA